jgi:hypothetical protein
VHGSVGLMRREVEHGCSRYVWLGRLNNLTDTEDGEDQRDGDNNVGA